MKPVKSIHRKYRAFKQHLEPHINYRKFKKSIKRIAKEQCSSVRGILDQIDYKYINTLNKLIPEPTKLEKFLVSMAVVCIILIGMALTYIVIFQPFK